MTTEEATGQNLLANVSLEEITHAMRQELAKHGLEGGRLVDLSQRMVREFHQTFLHPFASVPTFRSWKFYQIRKDFLDEEVREMQEALDAKNLTEFFDAVGDILYFAIGTLVAAGIESAELVGAIHNSNMTKLWPVDEEVIENHLQKLGLTRSQVVFRYVDELKQYVVSRADTGKIVKGPYFVEPDLRAFIPTHAETTH